MAAKGFDMKLFFAALADRTRLRLINLMALDEMCVCFFVEILGTNQPKISRHLGYLRRAGLVAARRDGKWIHYRLAEPSDQHAARVFTEVRAWLAEDAEMRRDRERLARVCCAPQLPVQLQGAPRPANLASGAGAV
jgi:ArsR family transcriptional regulator, arsenate/arsenite/antimonite-responsive transcriptional repressor